MSWIKIDDQFSEHPKLREVGPFGMALQVSAFCYCGKYLTDGFLSFSAAQALCLALACDFSGKDDRIMTPAFTCGIGGEDAKDMDWPKRMVDAELWENTKGGYLIHDYLEYNPSKETVLNTREKRIAAGSIGGKSKHFAKQKVKQNSSKSLPRTPSPSLEERKKSEEKKERIAIQNPDSLKPREDPILTKLGIPLPSSTPPPRSSPVRDATQQVMTRLGLTGTADFVSISRKISALAAKYENWDGIVERELGQCSEGQPGSRIAVFMSAINKELSADE